MYDEKRMAEAWRAFIASGDIDREVVRPEIARSWERCRAVGVNPWSSNFPRMDEALLREKRAQLAHSLEANNPVMRVLMALLNCNISLTDQENFVFEFLSPLSYYPRTFGTYCREEEVGAGNASSVAYERCPIRFDGYEHYRAVAHGYSGVSTPFLDEDGHFYGALHANNPFGLLPDCALDLCQVARDIANHFFMMGKGLWARLRTIDYFMPMFEAYPQPVLVLDFQGHVLGANAHMLPYVADFENYPVGTQSISDYLSKKTPMKYLISEPIREGQSLRVVFQRAGKRATHVLCLNHRQGIQMKNGLQFIVLTFAEGHEEVQRQDGDGAKPRSIIGIEQAADRQADYIGDSAEWRRIDEVVHRIAPIKAHAVLLGETGTGKEVVARAIHRHSGREGNFIAVNCGAIPRDLFAAELFGYEPGAFTGAREDGAIGKIEAANHGTLLLDEIGEMPLDMQVGLLRAIQENAVTRLGSNEARALDVRFIAATNRDLQQMVDNGSFRADLFYRLNMIEITLPPLRKREGDVSLLVDYFNRRACESLGLPYSPFPEDVLEAFEHYSWPGNVRELRNIVERCLILAGEGGLVGERDLPAHIANARSSKREFVPSASSVVASGAVAEPGLKSLSAAELEEREGIAALMTRYGGSLSRIAAELGISRTTLYKRLDTYQLRKRVVAESNVED